MTAINVVLRRDRAVMLTDAAMYTADGTIVGFGQKAVAIPSLKAVIACRGAQIVTALLAMQMSAGYRSFDHLAERAEQDLPEWHDSNVMDLSSLGMQDLNVIVAGWSDEKGAPAGFWLDTKTDTFDTIDKWAAGPMPTAKEDAELHSIGCELGVDATAGNFDPVRHGIPLMEAQRRMMIDDYSDLSDVPISTVGGHILLSEVTHAGVSQRVIHHWNDVAGEPIRPEPFRAAPPQGLSRQQRRALERQRRKQTA